jgi:hypothetical protein
MQIKTEATIEELLEAVFSMGPSRAPQRQDSNFQKTTFGQKAIFGNKPQSVLDATSSLKIVRTLEGCRLSDLAVVQ